MSVDVSISGSMSIVLQAFGSVAAHSGEPGPTTAGRSMGAEVVNREERWLPMAVLAPGVAAGRRPRCAADARESADDFRIFDAGDDLDRCAAMLAGVDLDPEDAFEALHPVHRDVLRHRTALPLA